MAQILYGSICLTDIPKELIKTVKCKDGKERKYLNISVHEKREKGQYGDTHFVSCAPKKDEQKEGVNYIVGNMKTHVLEDNVAPRPVIQPIQEVQQQSDMPIDGSDDLPF